MRGQQLTASQRLCVTIARAVLKKAPVLLLGEPASSALEAELVRVVKDALEHLVTGSMVRVRD